MALAVALTIEVAVFFVWMTAVVFLVELLAVAILALVDLVLVAFLITVASCLTSCS